MIKLVSAVGVLFILIQWIFTERQKKLNDKPIKISNYYGFSEHREFLMGVAAVLIVIFHGEYFTETYSDIKILNSTLMLLWHLDLGVDMFLIISGIGLYFSFENKKVNFRQYYTKRFLNVFLISLIIDLPYVIYMNFIVEKNSVINGFLWWTKLLNWTGIDNLSWYVVFVMILYALYPLIYKAMKKLEKNEKLEFLIVCAVCILDVLLCIFLNRFLPDLYATVEIALTRVPSFIIGCYLGKFVYNKKQHSNGIYAFSIIGIVFWFVLTNFVGGLMAQRFSHCLLALALCVILITVGDFLKAKINFIYKFFTFCGGMSLELYLVHMNIESAVFKVHTEYDSLVLYYTLAVLSFVIAYFISKLRKLIVGKYVNYCKNKMIVS